MTIAVTGGHFFWCESRLVPWGVSVMLLCHGGGEMEAEFPMEFSIAITRRERNTIVCLLLWASCWCFTFLRNLRYLISGPLKFNSRRMKGTRFGIVRPEFMSQYNNHCTTCLKSSMNCRLRQTDLYLTYSVPVTGLSGLV